MLMNSTTPIIESWFIPFSAIAIVSTALIAIFATLFIFIIVLDKTCHTVPLMLTVNSCLGLILVGCSHLSQNVFTLQNDLQKKYVPDSFCLLRTYFVDVSTYWFHYSFLVQAIYRYVTVIYPTRLFWQSVRCQAFVISITWVSGLVYPSVFLFNGQIKYDVDNQICGVPVQINFYVIYGAFCIYVIPVSMITFIYLKLVRYVKQMSQRIALANTLCRAHRELKMVWRTVILMILLVSIGFPYAVLILMVLCNNPSKYQLRIAFFFYDVSLILVVITLYQFTDPLKKALMKTFNIRTNVVVAAIA